MGLSKKAVLFDVDGTLCDVSEIRHLLPPKHLPREERDYKPFHAASINCPPIREVQSAARLADMGGLDVLIVTARGVEHRDLTEKWLLQHGIRFTEIFMRPDGDERIDVEVKRDALAYIREHWEPVHAWEDNPNIAELYRSEGIVCTVIPGWGGCSDKH